MNQLLQTFSKEGTLQNLTFSGQEILKDTIIGLDGIHRKVLVLRKRGSLSVTSLVIDLNKVKTCAVRKHYGTINSGDLKRRKLEQYLEKIALRFELYDTPPVEVVFYGHVENHIHEIVELENKARHWEVLLSKMVAPMKKTA